MIIAPTIYIGGAADGRRVSGAHSALLLPSQSPAATALPEGERPPPLGEVAVLRHAGEGTRTTLKPMSF